MELHGSHGDEYEGNRGTMYVAAVIGRTGASGEAGEVPHGKWKALGLVK